MNGALGTSEDYEQRAAETNAEYDRVIAQTKDRHNTEDLEHGKTLNISGVNPSEEGKSDEQLFSDFDGLVDLFTIFNNELRSVGHKMVKNFRYGKGKEFSDPVLNKYVSQSPEIYKFLQTFAGLLNSRLLDAGGDIDKVTNFTMPGRPVFNGTYNTWHGLKILINDTELTEITLNDLQMSPKGNWSATIGVTIYDHFGLDRHDVLGFQGFHSGFAAWYLLQARDYRPFVTKIEFAKRIYFSTTSTR